MIPTAHAYNFIDVGSDVATSTLRVSGSLFSDLSPIVYMILGVLLAALLITMLIGAFRKH